MTSNPTPPIVPGRADPFDRDPDEGVIEDEDRRVLDPDIDDDLIDSAEADRIAAGGDESE